MASPLRLLRISLLLLLTALALPAGAVVLQPGDILVLDGPTAAPPAVPPRVIRVHPGTGAQEVVSSGSLLDAPVAIAVEDAGSILVSDSAETGQGRVIRIDPSDGAQTVLSGSYEGLLGLTIDPADGAIFVTDAGATTGRVFEVNGTTGAPTPISSGSLLEFPQAITTAPDGQLYVADFGAASRVLRINPVGGGQSLFATGFQFASGVASQPGALWVTDASARAIVRLDLSSGSPSTVSSAGNLLLPFAIAVEASGQLVIADWGDDTFAAAVVRVNPVGGAQTIVSQGGFLVEPWGIAVVPEPAGSLLALAAAGALSAVRRLRRA